MRKLTSLLVAALVAVPAVANDHFYLGPQVTFQFWDKSRFLPGLEEDFGVQAGLNLGYEFAERYAAELNVQTNLSDTEANVYGLNLYHFLSSDRTGYTPYLVVGLEQVEMDPAQVITRRTSNISVGGGVSRYLSDYLELRADVRLRNALDDDKLGGDKVVDLGVNFALNYHLGRTSSPAPSAAVPASTQPARVQPPAPVAAAPAAQTRTITVELEVLFEFDSAVVSGVYGSELSEMAAALRNQPGLSLTLEGHTDSVGAAEYNQSLSQRRVDAVKQQLVSNYSIAADRVRAVGYGESRPIATNETAAGRAQNRRVVGVISFQTSE